MGCTLEASRVIVLYCVGTVSSLMGQKWLKIECHTGSKSARVAVPSLISGLTLSRTSLMNVMSSQNVNPLVSMCFWMSQILGLIELMILILQTTEQSHCNPEQCSR